MIRQSAVILQAFTQICLLRKRPQDLPASSELLLLALALNFLFTLLLAYIQDPTQNLFMITVLDTVIMLLFVYLLLLVTVKTVRWMQTVTAIAGTSVVFSIITTPIFVVLFQNSPEGAVAQFLFMIILILVIWNIVVLGHIFRNSLSASLALGVLTALFYIGTSIYITSISRNLAPA